LFENFKYDGFAPDATFWVGTEGDEPSPDGILLTYPFEGKFYDPEDFNAPVIDKALDGNQPDIVLPLPDDVKVSDLKWISIWSREYLLNFGDFIVKDELEGDLPKPENKPVNTTPPKAENKPVVFETAVAPVSVLVTPVTEEWLPNDRELFLAVNYNNLTSVKKALNKGGNPNFIHPKFGWTTIHHAAKEGYTEVIKALLSTNNANPNIKDKFGKTPIQRAAKNGHKEIVELLSS